MSLAQSLVLLRKCFNLTVPNQLLLTLLKNHPVLSQWFQTMSHKQLYCVTVPHTLPRHAEFVQQLSGWDWEHCDHTGLSGSSGHLLISDCRQVSWDKSLCLWCKYLCCCYCCLELEQCTIPWRLVQESDVICWSCCSIFLASILSHCCLFGCFLMLPLSWQILDVDLSVLCW